MFRALLVFAALAGYTTEALKPRVHMKLQAGIHMQLQAEPDQACTAWLASEAGQNFTNCESGNPGAPIATPDNNCSVTNADMDEYCSDPCFETLTNGYDFMLQTGTCLPVYEDKYKPCSNNTECPDLGAGPRICFEGFCYMSCTSTDDCNPCMSETCENLGDSQGCRSNMTQVIGAQNGLANRTIQNTFRGMIYSLKAACSQNDQDNYCSLMPLTLNTTCDSLADWGCCVGTILPSLQYCQWQNFTDGNMSGLFGCDMPAACADLPIAKNYCQVINVNGTTNGTTNSSSSGFSSGISSGSSGLTGSHGSTGVGGTGGNSAGQITISWAVTLVLALAAHIIS